MERMFQTHFVRDSREAEPLWLLTTLDEGGLSAPETVLVPGAWESHPALRNYRGRAMYTQNIQCGGNVRFWFGGVSFRARVFLDGKLLGEHYDAFTGFAVIARNVEYG